MDTHPLTTLRNRKVAILPEPLFHKGFRPLRARKIRKKDMTTDVTILRVPATTTASFRISPQKNLPTRIVNISKMNRLGCNQRVPDHLDSTYEPCCHH